VAIAEKALDLLTGVLTIAAQELRQIRRGQHGTERICCRRRTRSRFVGEDPDARRLSLDQIIPVHPASIDTLDPRGHITIPPAGR
jgi:hypothetical protein